METELVGKELPMQDLRGKTAIIIGASRGIGRAIALNLAFRGCRILGTCSNNTTYSDHIISLQERVCAAYKAAGNCNPPLVEASVVPLTDPDHICMTLTSLLTMSFGSRVDILVLNAAVAEFRTIDDVDEDHIYRNLVGNIETPIRLIQTLLPYFQPCSRIIFMSSESARLSRPGGLLHSATKAAMESAVRTLAEELGTREGMEGTTVNSVSVGLTNTGLVKNLDSKIRDAVVQNEARKVNVGRRIGEVDDIAQIVGFLASESSRWVTGSTISASGGATKIL